MSIPLVRTEGKAFADGSPSLVPERFVAMEPLRIDSRSEIAKAAEALFSLGGCLYFYAGHACPDFGHAVLVYEPSLTDGCAGHATPFDTGGLFKCFIHANSISDAATRRQYCEQHMVSLTDWPSQMQAYLTEYFASASSYVLGEKPTKDDPTHRLTNPQNSRRAWTWEVRIHRDHPLVEQLRTAFLSADYMEAVRQYLLDSDESIRRGWIERLSRKQVQAVHIGKSVHSFAEEEMAKCL